MSSVNWPLCAYYHVSVASAEGKEIHCIHDKCAFLFLVILVRKECVIVNSLNTRKLLINISDLLLQLEQAVPMSQDIVGDILLQTLYSRDAALEQGMQNDFL